MNSAPRSVSFDIAMTNQRSKLLPIQYIVAFVVYVGATLIHEEAAVVGLLTVPLITLKWAGVIESAWFWVLLPIWGEVVVGALVILGTWACLRFFYRSERPK